MNRPDYRFRSAVVSLSQIVRFLAFHDRDEGLIDRSRYAVRLAKPDNGAGNGIDLGGAFVQQIGAQAGFAGAGAVQTHQRGQDLLFIRFA